jgi:hypothetical protein
LGEHFIPDVIIPRHKDERCEQKHDEMLEKRGKRQDRKGWLFFALPAAHPHVHFHLTQDFAQFGVPAGIIQQS